MPGGVFRMPGWLLWPPDDCLFPPFRPSGPRYGGTGEQRKWCQEKMVSDHFYTIIFIDERPERRAKNELTLIFPPRRRAFDPFDAE